MTESPKKLVFLPILACQDKLARDYFTDVDLELDSWLKISESEPKLLQEAVVFEFFLAADTRKEINC